MQCLTKRGANTLTLYFKNMNRKKLLFGFSFVLFNSINVFAQLNSNVGNVEITKENELKIAAEKKEINKEVEKNSEPVLTPEQQGFTLITLPNGKSIYRKEVNGIVVEYFPEQD